MPLSAEIFLFLVSVALIAGFIDAIAGGGGLLSVPALLAVGIPPVAALATNKVQSSMGTATACFAYARNGHIDFRAMRLPVLLTFLGAAGGALVVQIIEPSVLAAVVPVLLIAMSLYFLLSPRLGDIDGKQRVGIAVFAFVVGAIGFYDGFFGPGAGSFYALSLVSLMGFGLVRATANTKLLNLTSNVAALLTMAVGGKMVWTLGLAMGGAAMIGGQLGSMAAMRFGGRLIRPLLVTISIALTVKLLADGPLA